MFGKLTFAANSRLVFDHLHTVETEADASDTGSTRFRCLHTQNSV
jgi:hypothetical protein